ncbi:hypothetical protein LCGC14_1997170 [marine sediment metagenome]|uniref:Uncharacterized protein n=1 Tax=marine sediment metagenome TaxID=412755 RepID=A0A0F9HHS5_9ZZZZ
MPCQACGSQMHFANDPSCPGPRIEMPLIDVKVNIVPSPEEQTVIILSEIKTELKRILEELRTMQRRARKRQLR